MGVLLVSSGGRDAPVPALAAVVAAGRAPDTALVGLAQTGLPDGRAGDLQRVARLVPVAEAVELARYPVALLPAHAAAASGRPALAFADTVRRLVDLDAVHERVVVHGGGGLLAPYDGDRHTLVDLAHALGAPVLVLATADPSGLERLLLTLAVLDDQGVPARVVFTDWPDAPDDAARWAVAELWRLSTRELLAGVVPRAARDWPPRDLRRRAPSLVTPALGGTFDARAFVARHAPG